MRPSTVLPLLLQLLLTTLTRSLTFYYPTFPSTTASTLHLLGDARLDAGVLRFTNDSSEFSIGRAFHATKLITNTSFSTSFVFSILPADPSTPGFGLAFVLSNSTTPPGALSGQYFGLFSNSSRRVSAPLLAVEFDTGRNDEFNDPGGNHVGIDLNYIVSSVTQPAGYYNKAGGFVPVAMRTGENIRAWVEFDPKRWQINVTIAPVELGEKPNRPLIEFADPDIANYLSPEMFVGFSASKVKAVEAQRVLTWSLADSGRVAPELNITNLPKFLPPRTSKGSRLSSGKIAGIVSGALVVGVLCLGVLFWYLKKGRNGSLGDEEVEDWELEYWPRRFSYEELFKSTGGFAEDHLLGSGGFGKVYRGVVGSCPVAVKCVSHESKQGLREFMAEISSMGRLQHKNLIQLLGWCRRDTHLMLVYDLMVNGSLNDWLFSEKKRKFQWEMRKRILLDVAEGLAYLHEGWEKVVLHRDVKPSNVLLDEGMRGRLGDFGLAKLHGHGEAATSTRLVGTLGYIAPELGKVAMPTAKSDVYSYGVVVMEVCCGKKAVEIRSEEDFVLVEWVRELYGNGKVVEAVDRTVGGGEEMVVVVKLGLACCHPDPAQRPSMKEVVEVLGAIGEDGDSRQQRLRFGVQ